MREIEVKAKLCNKDNFLVAAEKFGIDFSDPVVQEDATYESELDYADPNWNIFRLRKQNSKVILTMKHKASTRSRDNFEYETIVGNVDETIKILERLGYKLGVVIKKQRRTAKYNDLEICMDSVAGLGDFVEIEKLADDNADVDKIQLELWSILNKLGITNSARVHKGYDTLMHEQKSVK